MNINQSVSLNFLNLTVCFYFIKNGDGWVRRRITALTTTTTTNSAAATTAHSKYTSVQNVSSDWSEYVPQRMCCPVDGGRYDNIL